LVICSIPKWWDVCTLVHFTPFYKTLLYDNIVSIQVMVEKVVYMFDFFFLDRLLIFLGATTMLGGFMGFVGTILPCCYKSHVIFMSIAVWGTSVFCLAMFGEVHPSIVPHFLLSSIDFLFLTN